MRLLLDTQAFLWFVLNNDRLSAPARSLIAEPTNEVAVSPASYWEIAIKVALNKYQLTEPYEPFMEEQIAINRFQILPILIRHTAVLTRLPFHHRDPFDRLLVAQALVENIPLVSNDEVLDAYGIQRLW